MKWKKSKKENNESEIQRLHKASWKGLKYIIIKRGTLKKWPLFLAFSVSLVLPLFILISDSCKLYSVIKETIDLVNVIFPALLGFSLGGYAIVVGFSNAELIKQAVNLKKPSVYQLLSSIFSLSILVQIFATIFSFLITWVVNTKVFDNIFFGQSITDFTNFACLFFLLFGAIYSLLLTPYIILNLFSLSQLNNAFYTSQKIKEDKTSSEKEEE